jgi:2-keto-3-deoxy-L-rhamnonate aldolase RhmA
MTQPYWQTRKNTFKERIRTEPAVAMWLTVPWPPLAEIVGAAGADATFIDLEHTTMTLETAEALIIASEAAGVTPIARPAGIDAHTSSKLLDAGAMGLIFANIRTGAQAAEAIAGTLYPPAGTRGWGGSHTRYAMWEGGAAATQLRESDPAKRGVYSPQYVEKATNDILRVFIVESVEGVENIDDILAVEHLDAVLFGWADYAADVGFDVEACQAAADLVYRKCRERGVGISVSIGQAGETGWYPGSFYIAGIDCLLMSAALTNSVQQAKQAIG